MYYLVHNATITTPINIIVTNPTDIKNGENTNHHDQSIILSNLATTNINVNILGKPKPPVFLFSTVILCLSFICIT